MIGLTPLGWFPLGYYDEDGMTAKYPAAFEVMDCPDSWDDPMVQYSQSLSLGSIIPSSIPGKAKTWTG